MILGYERSGHRVLRVQCTEGLFQTEVERGLKRSNFNPWSIAFSRCFCCIFSWAQQYRLAVIHKFVAYSKMKTVLTFVSPNWLNTVSKRSHWINCSGVQLVLIIRLPILYFLLVNRSFLKGNDFITFGVINESEASKNHITKGIVCRWMADQFAMRRETCYWFQEVSWI